MEIKKSNKKIYDGKIFCGEDGCDCGCPVIEYDRYKNVVLIYDPSKPNNGKYVMSVNEYNTLIKNAKPLNIL